MSKLKKIIDNPWHIFSALARYGLFDWMPDRQYLDYMYRSQYKSKPNIDNPKLLNEKIIWLKLYNRRPEYTALADKYEVKRYIKEKIGEEYIIKTFGVWDSFEQINFNELPNRFVLKCTHDSSSAIVCKNKASFDIESARKKINKHLRKNYYYFNREWPYKNIKPRVIAEELIENPDGSELIDYKFYCYGGHPQYFMYSVGEVIGNAKNHKFDMNCNSIDNLFKKKPAIEQSTIKLPDNIDQMISIVDSLCKDFPHIRIDLYNNGNIYFGELTFYSNAGFMNIDSKEYSQYLSDKIDIERIKKDNNHE